MKYLPVIHKLATRYDGMQSLEPCCTLQNRRHSEMLIVVIPNAENPFRYGGSALYPKGNTCQGRSHRASSSKQELSNSLSFRNVTCVYLAT